MKKTSQKKWPEIVFGSSDSTESQAIRRAVIAGRLKKIAPRLYTSNLHDSPATIISRNAYHILGELFPGAVLSHRSALEGGISQNKTIILTYKYTRKIHLPGLTVRLIAGKGAQLGDTPFMKNLFLASRARALLENLQESRGNNAGSKKTLSRKNIEELLDKMCRVYGENELNSIRDQAKQIAKKLMLKKEWHHLDRIIGSLLGSQTTNLASEAGRFRSKGQPYDIHRLELFANLVTHIKNEIIPIRKNVAHEHSKSLQNLAFFESYFSNYIEGTEFFVDDAADIIFLHKLMPNRSEDAHDIIATFEIVSNLKEMNKIPKTAKQLAALLKARHFTLMKVRNDKHPGEFKKISNRVGNTVFVAPDLVEGTLIKAFELYETLNEGIERALYIMFIISEIHPFIDGNGRIARIMMNAELVHAGQTRIIIPTVYREDYLLALRRLSRTHDPLPYIKMLLKAQSFTDTIDFSSYEKALKQFRTANAFMLPDEAKLNFKDA